MGGALGSKRCLHLILEAFLCGRIVKGYAKKCLLQLQQFRCLHGKQRLRLRGQISQNWRGLTHAITYQKQGIMGIPQRQEVL